MSNEINLRTAKSGDTLLGLITEKLTEENGGKKVNVNSVWNKILDVVDEQQQETGDVYKGGSERKNWGKNYVIFVGQAIKFSQAMWDKIKNIVGLKSDQAGNSEQVQTSQVTQKDEVMLGKIKQVDKTPTATPADVQVDPILKANVEKAQKFLLKQLDELDEADLQQMGISSAKRDRLAEYIKNITFGNGHDSAEGKGAGIVFSVNCKDTDRLENMVTLLMHEANHCDENFLSQFPDYSEVGDLRHRDESGTPIEKKNVNTKEEERACETLGLLTTAVLIKKGVLSDENYGRYPEGKNENKHPVMNYLTDKNLLKNDVNTWVNGYTNYPEGVNNASITIEHLNTKTFTDQYTLSPDVKQEKLELKDGDVIKIGKKTFPISGKSNGVVLSALDSIPVLQMIYGGGNDAPGNNLGVIEFDNIKLSPEERKFYANQNPNNSNPLWFYNASSMRITVERDGKEIASGMIYNYDPNKEL